MTDQLADSAARLFTAHVNKGVLHQAGQGRFPQALWDAVVEAGFTAALLPEEAGGFGATVAEAMRVLQISAEHTAPIPLAETMLAGWLLASGARGCMDPGPGAQGRRADPGAKRRGLAPVRHRAPDTLGTRCRRDGRVDSRA